MKAEVKDGQLIITEPHHTEQFTLTQGSYGRWLVVFSTEERLDDFLWDTGYRGPLYCHKCSWYNAISGREFVAWVKAKNS